MFGKNKQFVALMFGYTAVGKSTTAKNIAKLPNTEIFHSAVVRKELDLTPKTPAEADKFFDWRNNQRQEVDKKVYTALAEKAADALKRGKNVVLDAGYFFNWQRKLVYDKTKEFDPEIFIVKVTCHDEDEIKKRMVEREKKFADSPLNETPSWESYVSSKLVTESIDKDIVEYGVLNVFEYDTLTKELRHSVLQADSENTSRLINSIVPNV